MELEEKLEEKIEKLKVEAKARRETQDMITDMFKPLFEAHPSGKILIESTKLERKIQDLTEPCQFFEDEKKVEKVLLFIEQLNALTDQFIKDSEVEKDGD